MAANECGIIEEAYGFRVFAMKTMFKSLFVVVLALIILPQFAQAQDNRLFLPQAPKEPEKQYSYSEVFNQLPPEIQQQLVDEAMIIEDECSGRNRYSTFYDCRCMAVKYIDQRIKLGPDANQNQVYESIDNKECRSIEGMAGYTYERCYRHNSMDPKVEEKCTCAANEVAKKMFDVDILSGPVVQRLTVQAFIDCGV